MDTSRTELRAVGSSQNDTPRASGHIALPSKYYTFRRVFVGLCNKPLKTSSAVKKVAWAQPNATVTKHKKNNRSTEAKRFYEELLGKTTILFEFQSSSYGDQFVAVMPSYQNFWCTMRVLILISCLLSETTAINILLFLIGTTQFERGIFEYLAQQLALRNHKTITVKPVLIPEEARLVKSKLHLVHEKTLNNLLPRRLFKPLEAAGNEVPWKNTYETDEYMYPYYAAHVYACKKMLNSNLMDTLKRDKIDVAIVYSGNPCQLAIVHALHIPFIYFDIEGFTDETRVASGTPLNFDIPASQCRTDKWASSFLQRIVNGMCILREYIVHGGLPWLSARISERYARMDAPISELFSQDYEIKKRIPNFPNINEIKQKAELYFINTDRLIEYEHALPPHVIPVAGLHIDQVKPLFHPWNSSIASSEKGTIVVSLGTQANSSAMTLHQARSIFGALSRLNSYRIYWRIGPSLHIPGISSSDIPSHINVTTFIPQNDLLADKRTRLLITNGGMQSIMEALVHGVPVVGIPLYGVNRHNMAKVQNKGLGVVVPKDQLSELTLFNAIKEVLQNAKYKKTAKDMAREWKQRPQTAFQTALHYIEHVGKHHRAAFFGAPHRPFSWARTLNIDLLLTLFLIIVAPIVIAYKVLVISTAASYRYKKLLHIDSYGTVEGRWKFDLKRK